MDIHLVVILNWTVEELEPILWSLWEDVTTTIYLPQMSHVKAPDTHHCFLNQQKLESKFDQSMKRNLL